VNSSTLSNRFNALNISQISNFSPNSTLQSLVDQLFVEKWSQKLNYSSYYAECQPQYCQYDINQRSAPLYIITSLLGLYGGLSVVLHFIIPFIVTFILKRLEKRATVPVDQTNHASE
jgi:hypothetical protein